jgi:hypothetical protein
MRRYPTNHEIEDRMATWIGFVCLWLFISGIWAILWEVFARPAVAPTPIQQVQHPLSPPVSQSVRPTSSIAREATSTGGDSLSSSRHGAQGEPATHSLGAIATAGEGIHHTPWGVTLELRHWPEEDDFVVRDDNGTVRVTITKEALRELRLRDASIDITSANAHAIAKAGR